MWQTIATIIVLVGAVVFAIRHFLRIYRTGGDPACCGCSSAECCSAKAGKGLTCNGEHSLFPESDGKPR